MTRQYNKQEDNVKIVIADYLNYQYPQVPFFMQWDHIKLPVITNKKGQTFSPVGAKLKRMRWNNPDFVWPDCFIAYPNKEYNGLWLEIKKDRNEIWTKTKGMKTDLQTTKEMKSLQLLTKLGYKAEFTWSFEHAKGIIDEYMN